MTPNLTALATAPLQGEPADRAIHKPTPTRNLYRRQRLEGFDSLVQALDYAAGGETGYNFYSGRGDLIEALPYSELRRRAEEAARRLASLGLRRWDRFALLA